METENFKIQKELSVHQRGVILRGICNGAALRNKQPQISENNTVITSRFPLSGWDICCISCDAEAFGLKAKFGYNGTTHITFIPQSPQTYHCDKCGSTDVTPTAWCNYCGTHTTLVEHNEFMEQIESWWKDGASGEDYEVITGLNEADYNPENDSKEFTDACNAIWNVKSDGEKIEIWKTITHREEYE